MNITRRKENNNFTYFLKNKKITNRNVINTINSFKIPPAYNNVLINENFNDDILATGNDDKGRKQYIYNPNYAEEKSEIKFCDLITFGKKVKRIRSDILASISKKKNIHNKEDLIYIVLYLIDNCNFRVGSKKYKSLYDSYGVTTLNSNHFKFLKNHVKVEFVGKKGIINKSIIKNKYIIDNLIYLCKLYQNEEFIFSYKSEGKIFNITDKIVNNFLQSKYNKHISVKMFRTWNANTYLLKEILDSQIPNNPRQASKNISDSIKKIAEKLHHTPSVSKKSYLNNDLINLYTNNFKIFYKIINEFLHDKSKFPTTDRILNVFLEYICKLNNLN